MARRPALSTMLIHPGHADETATAGHGSAPVIERSTTFPLDQPRVDAMVTGQGLRQLDVYGRFGTSTGRVAADLIARLEGAEACALTASGMAAITTTLTTLVPAGGRIACAEVVYGGTESVLRHELEPRGVRCDRFDARRPETLAPLLDPPPGQAKPDLVWCESIANPLMRIGQISAIARLCADAGVPLGVDATFAGGMAQNPLALGASVVVHSATKVLNGHSDVVAGAIASDAARVDACFATIKRQGGCVDPQAAWLLQRGIRTLPLRWAAQNRNSEFLAERLRDHPKVRAVHWPGFEMEAMVVAPLRSPGTMLAFELEGGFPAVRALFDAVQLCTHAVSLGGLETLLSSPAWTSHTQLAPEVRRARGIADGLVRLSAGIEDCQDLWDDLERALAQLSA